MKCPKCGNLYNTAQKKFVYCTKCGYCKHVTRIRNGYHWECAICGVRLGKIREGRDEFNEE